MNKVEQEEIKKIWIKKLGIKKFLPIHIIPITQRGMMDKIIRYNSPKCVKIFLNKNSGENVIAHELGHLYFPKAVNDHRLLPNFIKPESRRYVIPFIRNWLNSLVDNFVDHHLLDIDNYYSLWVDQKRKSLEKEIFFNTFKKFDHIADFMCEYLNCHYILKKEDNIHLYNQLKDRLNQIEKYILKINNFSETNLDLLIIKLDQFKKFRYLKDSEKILEFLYEIITEIGKALNPSYWDKIMIDRQFEIIFNFQYKKAK